MKINTKIRYGLRTMIEIACSNQQEGILQKDIAMNQNISIKYLDTIVASLKLKGLIANIRGKGSGYVLARSADDISIHEIYTAFERIEIVDCINNKNFCERATHDCTAHNFWKNFQRDVVKMLSTKSLQEIINETNYTCKDCIIL